MSDDSVQQHNYPTNFVPHFYADTVTSITNGGGIVKFYLGRYDIEPFGNKGINTVPIAQIAMPMLPFVQMVAFLKRRVEAMEQAALVPKGYFDKAIAQIPLLDLNAG